MMGTHDEVGGYSAEDNEFTKKFKTVEAKKEANIKELKKRFKYRYENNELITFYTNKMLYVWGDGDFFAEEKLARHPQKNLNIKYYILNSDENKNEIFNIFVETQLVCMLIFIVLEMVLNKYIDEKGRKLTVILNICHFGVFLFFLIWEARSRYIVNYLPLLLLESFFGIEALKNYINKKRILK